MKKIKNWFIDDINFHLMAMVLITMLDLITKPSLEQFAAQVFGYFSSYFLIKIIVGGKKMGDIPWEDYIRNIITILHNKNSTTINQNFKADVNDFKKFNDLEKKILRKSDWHERLESMTNERKSKYDNSSTIDIGGSGSSVTVNGKTYRGKGSVSIINGKVKIDGKTVTDESRCDNVIVEVKGDLRNLTIDGTATCIINGNVKGNVDSHNLDCGNVEGNVNAHKVRCGTVAGNVNAHKVTKP